MKPAPSLIGKTLVAFVLLLAVYEVLVRQLPTGWLVGQNQFQRNVIVAERFTDRPASEKPRVLLLGSSLTYRLGPYYNFPPLPAGVELLAFGGGTAFDGVELIRQSGRYPDTVLIEINVPYTYLPNKTLLSAVFNPPGYPLRKYVHSLRTVTQPSNVALQGGYMLLKGNTDWRNPPAAPAGVRDDATFAQSLAVITKEKTTRPQPTFMAEYIHALDSVANELQQQGCKVILFRLPVDASIEALTLQQTTIEQLRQYAQTANLPLIEFSAQDAATMDGLHLDMASALRIREQLFQRIHRP